MDAFSINPPGDISSWVYKAEGDFRTATTMVRKRKDPVPDNVCFCAQQCVEKYLKAFLVLHRIYFPKIHDLLALLDYAADVDKDLESLRDDLIYLSPFAAEIRYPGENATVEESKKAVKIMRRVRRILRHQLNIEAKT
jgi:HEPN domain-containing protein